MVIKISEKLIITNFVKYSHFLRSDLQNQYIARFVGIEETLL